MTAATPSSTVDGPGQLTFVEHFVALTIVCGVALLGNAVGPDIPIATALPGMLVLLAVAVAGVGVRSVTPWNVPTIVWISLIGIVVSTPWTPGSTWLVEQVGNVDFLALATPILAYAGLGLSRGELQGFARSGWKIVVVALVVFLGTYIGSALIAELVLSLTG